MRWIVFAEPDDAADQPAHLECWYRRRLGDIDGDGYTYPVGETWEPLHEVTDDLIIINPLEVDSDILTAIRAAVADQNARREARRTRTNGQPDPRPVDRPGNRGPAMVKLGGVYRRGPGTVLPGEGEDGERSEENL